MRGRPNASSFNRPDFVPYNETRVTLANYGDPSQSLKCMTESEERGKKKLDCSQVRKCRPRSHTDISTSLPVCSCLRDMCVRVCVCVCV